MRLQLALNVKNLDSAIAYYSKMFDAEPHKIRKGYANFAIDNPALKLVLFENPLHLRVRRGKVSLPSIYS